MHYFSFKEASNCRTARSKILVEFRKVDPANPCKSDPSFSICKVISNNIQQ